MAAAADEPTALPTWWADSQKSAALTSERSIEAAAQLRLDAPAVSAELCRRGFTVIDKFLGSPSATKDILAGIQQLDRDGLMRLGKIQQGTTQNANTESRTDRIAFLPSFQQQERQQEQQREGDSSAKSSGASAAPSTMVSIDACGSALKAYTAAADAMRAALTAQPRLVSRVGGSLDDCTVMCACYPGGGARYVKHRDALPYKAGRKLTLIYYLNAEWQPGHGGELRIWPSDDPETEQPVVVPPVADRLVVFISSLEHEVLPAWRPRYALTTWMFNKKDTAMEVLAEEMRQRKAKGKMNMQALLAALDADSSSEEEEEEEEDEEDEDEEGDASAAKQGGGGVNRKAAMSVMMQLLKRKQAKERLAKQAASRAAEEGQGAAAPGAAEVS